MRSFGSRQGRRCGAAGHTPGMREPPKSPETPDSRPDRAAPPARSPRSRPEGHPGRTDFGFELTSPCPYATTGNPVDDSACPTAIGAGAAAAPIDSMMASAENSAVASARSRISASGSPSAEILRIWSSVIV